MSQLAFPSGMIPVFSSDVARLRTIVVTAIGTPAPKGSKRGFVIPGRDGGKPRAILVDDNRDKPKIWAAVVADAAASAARDREWSPLAGCPISVTIEFLIRRPKGHYRANGTIKPDAETWCAKKPDADKLARSTLDALTGILYQDDAQIASLTVRKLYLPDGKGMHTGCVIAVSPLE